MAGGVASAPLTSVARYWLVFDTFVDDMRKHLLSDRSWGAVTTAKTAVWEYLKTPPEFEIDKNTDHKLLISVVPDGCVKRVG